MLSLEEAQSRILEAAKPGPTEIVPLSEASDHICGADCVNAIDLPPFDNSSMDGYAVRASDTVHAATGSVKLRLVGKVAAGDHSAPQLLPGTCIRVFTGSSLPAGADAVIMQEDTRADHDAIQILDTAATWENVRFRGEDVKKGTTILQRGERIGPAQIALAGAVGLASIPVFRPPRVTIIATGSELQEPGEMLASGKIYESNRAMLAALVRACGCDASSQALVPDTLADMTSALRQAFAGNDVIITSGGVSVGEFDYVKEAFEAIGGKIEVWRVALKPGKPLVFGQCGGKYLFGLPGNPVSAFVTFVLLVRPALLRMLGASELALPRCFGRLGEDVANRGNRRHFMRVRLDSKGEVRLSGKQGSHILSSLTHANGLLDVPPETVLGAGQNVEVLRW